MLVITRRSEESLLIGTEIVIEVLSIQGGQVRLGISAPKTYKVLRSELVNNIPEQVAEVSSAPASWFARLQSSFKTV